MQTLLTAVSVLFFGGATALGVRAMYAGSYRQYIVGYGTFVALLNTLFRTFTLAHRLAGNPLPQPFSTSVALVLQVAIATFLFIAMWFAVDVLRALDGRRDR